MIRGVLARFTLFLALVSSVITMMRPGAAWVTMCLLILLIWLVPHGQRVSWFDGWRAAHDHHRIEGPDKHVGDYQNFMARVS